MSVDAIIQGEAASRMDFVNVRCQSWKGSKLALDLLVQLGRREHCRGHFHLAAREKGASGFRERSVAGDNGLTRAMASSTRGEPRTEVVIRTCRRILNHQSVQKVV